MKIYLISLGCGLLVGAIYSLLHVRSPAPPVVALIGLLGILLGEQAVPIWRWMTSERVVSEATVPARSLGHVFGQLPSAHKEHRQG